MCNGNKKCRACQIAGLSNNSKMKKKINFKGVASNAFKGIGKQLIGGTGGAALKMGFNFMLNTIDKEGKVTGLKKHALSLGVPILGHFIAPKFMQNETVSDIVVGHNAITIFQAAQELLPEDIAAKVSGYEPYSVAGYRPYNVSGSERRLPFESTAAQANPLV